MDSYLESGAITDARGFPENPKSVWELDGEDVLAHICVGPTGERVSWASTLKSLENNNLLTQQFHDFHTINDVQFSDSLQRLIATHDPQSKFRQAKYRQSTPAETVREFDEFRGLSAMVFSNWTMIACRFSSGEMVPTLRKLSTLLVRWRFMTPSVRFQDEYSPLS